MEVALAKLEDKVKDWIKELYKVVDDTEVEDRNSSQIPLDFDNIYKVISEMHKYMYDKE